jgi:hypothetical protein
MGLCILPCLEQSHQNVIGTADEPLNRNLKFRVEKIKDDNTLNNNHSNNNNNNNNNIRYDTNIMYSCTKQNSATFASEHSTAVT